MGLAREYCDRQQMASGDGIGGASKQLLKKYAHSRCHHETCSHPDAIEGDLRLTRSADPLPMLAPLHGLALAARLHRQADILNLGAIEHVKLPLNQLWNTHVLFI